jgi:uncharacterized protein YecT (DUF1311 family)
MKAFLAGALAFFSAAPVAATEMNCGGLNTQMELNICEGKKLDKADAALNDVYAKLSRKVSAEGKAKLLDAQRAWLKYRDQQCAFETLATVGGSIHPMEVAICLTELTKDQTKRLRAQLACGDGDICGGQ